MTTCNLLDVRGCTYTNVPVWHFCICPFCFSLLKILLPSQEVHHLIHVAAPTVNATNTRTHVPSQLDAPRLNLESEMWRNSHKCDSDIAFLGASQLWGQCMRPLPNADRDDGGYEDSFPWSSPEGPAGRLLWSGFGARCWLMLSLPRLSLFPNQVLQPSGRIYFQSLVFYLLTWVDSYCLHLRALAARHVWYLTVHTV